MKWDELGSDLVEILIGFVVFGCVLLVLLSKQFGPGVFKMVFFWL